MDEQQGQPTVEQEPQTEAADDQSTEVQLYSPDTAKILTPAYKAAGTVRVTLEQEAILMEEIDPLKVQIHPVTGAIYMGWVEYVKRLNRAFGPMGWAPQRLGKPNVTEDDRGKSLVEIQVALIAEGRLVRDATGECRKGNDSMTFVSCLEGAIQNAIKKCCKAIGMFTELWDKDWCDQWVRQYAISYKEGNYTYWRKRMPSDQPAGSQQQQKTQATPANGKVSRSSKELFVALGHKNIANDDFRIYMETRFEKTLTKDLTADEIDTALAEINDGTVQQFLTAGAAS